MQDTYENILEQKRGYVAKWPENKLAVMIVSGGLDSMITSARLIREQGLTLYPLHIERGQTNFECERASIEKYSQILERQYPDKFKPVKYIKLNVPPIEFKKDLLPYMREHGHPLRDTVLQLAAAQYAVSLQASANEVVRTIFCAVMPEDIFPHSNLTSIRATNVALCQNTGDWTWLVSSPNIDLRLVNEETDKSGEIRWASEHDFPSEYTVSCNDASRETDLLNCGTCSSCTKRKQAFARAGVDDKTRYYREL